MRNLLNKNILVTGGTGLVGGHLTEKLINKGANIYLTYRSFNPKSYFASKNLNNKVVSAIADINDYSRILDIVSKYEIDYIFHMAAQPIVGTAFVNPYETLKTNIMGTVNVLEAARLCKKVKGVVVASSDKAYGKKCDKATETEPLAGDHPYDASKSCTDLIAQTYYKTYGLSVAISRFGNIYGSGDLNNNRIIPGIMNSIISGKELEIRSDGKFIRDYVYVKDVVDGYILLMENIDKVKGEAFNFSTGYNFTVLELIMKISVILGQECKFNILNNQNNEIPSQSLDFSKIQRILNWESQYTFEEGVKETFDWYKNN